MRWGFLVIPPDLTRGMVDLEKRAYMMLASVKYAPLKVTLLSLWLKIKLLSIGTVAVALAAQHESHTCVVWRKRLLR
jgi:hypothetical protein